MFPSYRNQSVDLTGFYMIEKLVIKDLTLLYLLTYLFNWAKEHPLKTFIKIAQVYI